MEVKGILFLDKKLSKGQVGALKKEWQKLIDSKAEWSKLYPSDKPLEGETGWRNLSIDPTELSQY